jgi:hypothetical protein
MTTNETAIRKAYQVAEDKDIPGWVDCFTKDGTFTGGGWAQPRVLTVQFQNIESNNISEFKKPNTQVVVYPPESASVSVIYPYAKAKRRPGCRR